VQKGDFAPLSRGELTVLPHLIAASNMYVLYWGLRDYLSKPVNPQEYLVYLRHNIGFARWFTDPSRRAGLRAMLMALPRRVSRVVRS
jgi:hypothetical protein